MTKLTDPIRAGAWALAAGLLVAAAGPAMAQTAEPIKIGAVLCLTGPGAGLGQAERNGIQLAEEAINDAGGVGGRPIKVLIEDDGSKPDIAKQKAEGLIFNDKVVAVIGGSLTASTGAIAALTNAEEMAEVALTGLGPAVELTYKSLYHVLPPQSLNAKAMLEYTKANKLKKIGVLHDSGYGQLVFSNLKTMAASYGVEFVAVEKFEVGASDVSTQAAKVRAAEPEAVYVIATSPVPFRSARQVKITQPIISAIGSSAYDYVRGMGEFGDDIVFPEFLVGEDPEPQQKAFVELYKKTYGALPKNYEAAGWDAVNIVAQAIAKAGPNADRQAIAQAMRQPFKGVLANYDFSAADLTGIDLSSYVFSKLVKGQFTRLPFKVGS
ncbi:ABC transporter substrate-binding protein [Chelatococcus reniformis]|uniref:Branched-chain amino acid ABC transporter substrate-binding protein n=1 Tax=Chelatococcus reniformis TaxID=1494448 RepID=A0A916XCF5_9HYPH|nr:ABC transporter substrate-binding protein [Chelatococcus reniformis]GGC61531.1 branched-chain amino acid ABC transporter substrate-binding protein [Chelatococcus reniformis]